MNKEDKEIAAEFATLKIMYGDKIVLLISQLERYQEAIKNLINRNKELEEKNRVKIIGKYGDVTLDELLKDNYIPKSKVKEEIEKLEETRKNLTVGSFMIDAQIGSLKRLLQE